MSTIGFAGLTHLGVNSAVAAAAMNYQVVAYDTNSTLTIDLDQSKVPFEEPDLIQTMIENKKNIQFTSVLTDLEKVDFVVVSPDIKTDEYGNSDLSELLTLLDILNSSLPESIDFVILSQVRPGFTRQLQHSFKRNVVYQVETLIFGEALHRALHPERIIVGLENANRSLNSSYLVFLESFDCPILKMLYESAELTKIAINCCLVSSISVANTLSGLCEQIGANWNEIVPALKLDKRIGAHAYLQPGLGLSGGNLERDLSTVLQLTAENGTHSEVVTGWIQNSHYQKDWVLRVLYKNVFAEIFHPNICIWGLAYKENTNSIKNSPSVSLIEQLSSFTVKVYDPVVTSGSLPSTISSLMICGSALEALNEADILIIMTPWKCFLEISLATIQQTMKGNLIIDPYHLLTAESCMKSNINYETMGC